VTVVTFVLTYILPGNPALVRAGPLAAPEHIAEMGGVSLDQPMVVQYGALRGLFRGDLGESHTTGRPVREDLLQRVPATLELTLAALLVALAVGIPLGVVAAVRRDGWLDHVSRLVGVGGVAMPTFWTGLLALYIFFYALGVAPPRWAGSAWA
jgi:peptide/nickel transport system permease protein